MLIWMCGWEWTVLWWRWTSLSTRITTFGDYWSVLSYKLRLSGSDWIQWLWTQRKSDPTDSRSRLWDWTYLSVSLSCVSHLCALPDEWERTLSELLHPEELANQVFFIFDGKGYLQYGWYGWQGCHSLCYYTYLNAFSYAPKYAIALAYRAIFVVMKRLAIDSTGKGAEQDVCGTKKTH